ncbi:MAG: hypothetical protein ACREQ9_17510 [Candidatus Binatia bacterium]
MRSRTSTPAAPIRGALQGGEQCDDGNLEGGDGCSEECFAEGSGGASCQGKTDGAACNDGDPCTIGDSCQEGACPPGHLRFSLRRPTSHRPSSA